jgi:hypothetical protein
VQGPGDGAAAHGLLGLRCRLNCGFERRREVVGKVNGAGTATDGAEVVGRGVVIGR